VLRILVRAESVTFMAIAVALVVMARGGHDLVLAPRGDDHPGGQQRAVQR
jgi:hypothetical protein